MYGCAVRLNQTLHCLRSYYSPHLLGFESDYVAALSRGLWSDHHLNSLSWIWRTDACTNKQIVVTQKLDFVVHFSFDFVLDFWIFCFVRQ